MRLARWLVAGAILSAPDAVAQPKRGPATAPPAQSEPPAPAAREPAAAQPASGAKPPETALPATSAAPPAPAGAATRLSPLTPRADEAASLRPGAAPAELERLLADIAALRARVAALTQSLFKSSLRVVLATEGDDSRIATLVVTLDDGVVYRAPALLVAEDGVVVYEHAVAPGHHVLGLEVERFDARGKEWRTWQATKLSVVVPEGKRLQADVELEDGSAMAEDFPEDEDGDYQLEVRLRARVVE